MTAIFKVDAETLKYSFDSPVDITVTNVVRVEIPDEWIIITLKDGEISVLNPSKITKMKFPGKVINGKRGE